MKAVTQIRIAFLAILLAIVVATGCSDGAFVTEKVTTSGTVAAKDKDAAGKVTSIEIKTGAGPGMTVENSGKGKELFGMIDKKVEVSGMVKGGAETKTMTVESYKVID
ncbi:MAG: hypothetical protein C4530_07085 [Desulfobacteraceae bacterium]|nr:MAG: hypothetical protein C4530_07085 [Desulfobacteraceae bacterium]